ncbi:pentatricopeptide repeat-containing protein At5g65570 [Humulus lupulus]|uniref:pentatricopeptide repeat-containing protein At5g65570 n=1 Tax=Humulus lupulus TaxID=3486 RepID=UPI002B403296|nr:pentatricopeptide repeat-containing protein At5g65570 [Humulus lupulus]
MMIVALAKLLNFAITINNTNLLINHCRFLTFIVQNSINEASFNSTSILEGTRLCSLIQQCIENKSLTKARLVHAHAIKFGLLGLSVGNKLTDAYLKCGCIVDTRKLFDELPERYLISWNSMISYYIGQGKCKEAILLYTRMVSEGVLPDNFTFSSVFKAFSELGLVNGGREAHGMSIVLGLEVSNKFVGSALVDMYAKLGKMKEAHLVADRVMSKDVVLLTALIVGYTQHGDGQKALKVFGEMIRQGINANEYTFASILITCGNVEDVTVGKLVHVLMVKSGLESVVASQTSLLTMYARCGLIDDSLKVFKNFSCPNQVTWTSLLVALIQNGKEEVAFSKFKEMIRSSILPNSFTLSSVLQACSSLAMLEGGKQIHAMVMKFGLDRDRYAGSAVVNLYGKCGSTEMARSVFDALVEYDVVSMNFMIYSYAQNGFGHEAIKLFHKMKELDLEPNEVTVLSVLLACNNAGLVEEGCQIFDSINNNQQFELTRDHYACMVNLLGRCGRLEEAEILVKQVRNPDVVLWRTLLSACKIHGEVEMAERALKQVLDLSPEDEGTYVLMSNLYASAGNWNQVIEMKSTMREIKLKKNPAMSWVEIDKEVHTFMAGDWSHPSSKEILDTLEYLIEKVKNLGYTPDTRFVLQNMDEEKKKRSLYYHSEKLAIAFALWKTNNRTTTIRLFKNLRVCGDCHSWIKFVSKAAGREIIARDAKRFHHFKEGLCSCGDYW